MAKKVARSAIHAQPQNTFSPLQANENTRDKWDRSRYEKKNEDTSHHYDITRKKLNFVVTADGIKPLDTTNTQKLYGRYIERLAELNFKAYDPTAANQPNSYIDWVFSGDHDAMAKLAFGDQEVDFSLKNSNAHIRRMPAFEQYARDVYDFACMKFGKENVIGVEAHLDETTPHVHVNVIPVAMRQQKGRASYLYVNRNDPSKTITSKQYKALNSQARKEWERSTQLERKEILAVSYSGLIGETRAERGKYLKQFHTDFFEQVGKKYGLERGRPRETLTEEEQKEVRHKTAAELEEERLEKIQELKELDAKIEEMQQNAGRGAKILSWMGVSDTAYTKGKADGIKEAKEKIFQATGLKVDGKDYVEKISPEQFGKEIKQLLEEAEKTGKEDAMKAMIAITGGWVDKTTKKPYVPSPEEYAQNYKHYKQNSQQLGSDKKNLEEEIRLLKEGKNTAVKEAETRGRAAGQRRADIFLKVLRGMWPTSEAAVKAILDKSQNPSSIRFTVGQAESVFNALKLSLPEEREDAAQDLITLAEADFKGNPNWLEDTAEEVLNIAGNFAQLAILFAVPAQSGGVSSGGGGGGNNDLPKKRDDEWNRRINALLQPAAAPKFRRRK